jgi:hypothetical protein
MTYYLLLLKNSLTFVVSTSERVKQSDRPVVHADDSTAQFQRNKRDRDWVFSAAMTLDDIDSHLREHETLALTEVFSRKCGTGIRPK